MYTLFPQNKPLLLDHITSASFPPPLSIPDPTKPIPVKVRLSDKCYLCMNNILPSSIDTVVLRCFERCGTRLHYKCVKDSMWSPKGENIICPTCTKDEHAQWTYGWGICAACPRSSGMREYEFLCGMRTMLKRPDEKDLKYTLKQIQSYIDRKANTISGRDVSREDVENEYAKAAQELRLHELLRRRFSIGCIYKYITNRMEGLLLMGLCIEDLVSIERNGDMADFVRLYGVHSSMLRSYLGQDEMSLANIIQSKLSPLSMDILGITVHELCIMRLTQDEMHLFDWLKMKDWIQSLKMTPTCIRVLRISTSDFVHPKGKLGKMGWKLDTFCQWMNLDDQERQNLRLSKVKKKRVWK